MSGGLHSLGNCGSRLIWHVSEGSHLRSRAADLGQGLARKVCPIVDGIQDVVDKRYRVTFLALIGGEKCIVSI